MPRKARWEIAPLKGLYHIVTRGNNQRRIFRAARDYKRLLDIIKETKKLYPFLFYSYTFLPNHYHLALETLKVPISKIMHKINFSYATYFRHRYRGSGHLFEGRFFSSFIDKDSYLWELAAYIDLNPVRAGLASKPEDYPWGSYSVYFHQNFDNSFLDWAKFLGYIDENLERAQKRYLKFVEERLRKEIMPEFKLGPKFL